MRAFHVLEKDLSITGYRALEASAGTGKTFSIQHVALRLILEEKIPLEEILLVTFTKASTRELKSRVRANIEEVLSHLRKGKSLYPYVGNCEKKEAIHRLEKALFTFDEASIYTIHGFCHHILKEHAFISGLCLEQKLVEEQELILLQEQFIRRVFYSISEKHLHPVELDCLWKSYSDFSSLSKAILHCIDEKRMELSTEQSEFHDFSHYYTSFVEKSVDFAPFLLEEKEQSTWLPKMQEALLSYKKLHKTPFSLEQELEYFFAFLKGDLSEKDFASWIDLGILLFSCFSEDNRNKRKKCYYPKLEALEKKAEALLTPLKELISSARIVQKLAVFLRPIYEKMLQEKKIITPDDLLHQTKALLANPAFVKGVQSKYQAVIIDESQDTDPIQWQIFHRLFQQGLKAFYLVGDPKQSIYGFRRADIYTYMQALQSMEERFSLSTNYRSEKSLVSALNRLFSFRKNWLYLPKKKQVFSYETVDPFSEEDPPNQEPLLQFFLVEEKSGRGKWPSNAVEESYFFPKVAQTALHLRKQNKHFRMAVLVKDRYQGASIQSFFTKCGIKSSLKSSHPIYKQHAYQETMTLLQAAAFAENPANVRKALLTSFFGYLPNDLIEMPVEIFQELQERFLEGKKILEEKGLAPFFSYFWNQKWNKKMLPCRLVEQGAFLQARAAVEHLLEVAKTHFFSIDTLDELIDCAEKHAEKAAAVEEDAIEIMTIHASKGLEFDVVFSLGLMHRTKLHPTDQKELDAEKFRQLYVALTRAKTYLYVPLLIDSSRRIQEGFSTSSMELFISHLLGFTTGYEGVEKMEKSTVENLLSSLDIAYVELEKNGPPLATPSVPKADLVLQKAAVAVEKPLMVYSFSSLQEGAFSAAKDASEDAFSTGAPDKNGLPLGASTGTLFHQLIEFAFAESNFSVEDILKKHLPKSWLSYEKEMASILKKAFFTPLFKGGPTAASIPPCNRQVEMAFTYREKDAFYKGVIDLVFCHEEKYYIVDWKTNYLGQDPADYAPSILEEYAEEKGYFLQGTMYTKALQKYLKSYGKSHLVEKAFFVFLRGEPGIVATPQLAIGSS